MRASLVLFVTAAAFAPAACSSASSPNTPAPILPQSQAVQAVQPAVYGDDSIIQRLYEKTVGSVVDPVTGDVNPYGLAVAAVQNGKINAGDLVVCDFNDNQNVQGTGTAIVAIAPTLGSKPRHIVDAKVLEGCNAVALAPDDTIWPADFVANNAPIITPDGKIITTEGGGPWHGPFGETFVPPVNDKAVAAFYVSNAGDGSLVRISLGSKITFTIVATGFPVNGGPPGSILGPSGLNYDPAGDRLYVVDGTHNTLYAIDHISMIPKDGITVNGLKFSGPFAKDAHVIYNGAPLNGPISSALLPGGHIALGNTTDPSGKNLIIELTPSGKVVDVRNIDTGAAGAIFGMAATGHSPADAKLYFNDDNDNTLRVLTPCSNTSPSQAAC